MSARFEIVVEDLDGAEKAMLAGVDSIELCTDLASGGLTPSCADIQAVCEMYSAHPKSPECHVLVLHKPSAFYVGTSDLDALEHGIECAREAGADGVVFGALDPADSLDMNTLRHLCRTAGSMQKTFHRAFDRIPDQYAALNELVWLGFNRILTSGRPGKSGEHVEHLRDLIAYAGNRIQIVVGGGVSAESIPALKETARADYLHMSCRYDQPDAKGFYATDSAKIRQRMALVRGPTPPTFG